MTSRQPKLLKAVSVALGLVGLLLLTATWFGIYLSEHLFAESHLASYYCCLMPDEIATIDPRERAVADFFRTSPGRDLPGLVFIAANSVLFAKALRKAPNFNSLVLTFVLANLAYLCAAVLLVEVSWSISHFVVGPPVTPYKGYHRTWYGIVLHFAPWGGYFWLMLRAHTFGNRAGARNA